MKKLGLNVLVILAATVWLAVISVFAQASLSSWPFFVEVTPNAGAPGIYDLVVPLEVMDKAREDLADLRLYDSSSREIPYAVRIRREIADKREIGARVFNRAIVGSTTSEVSVDLGESPGEHNEVEIETSGKNFRRQVEVEGSDSGKEWRTLETGGMLFSFEAQNRAVASSRVTYPTSRYRYLRVRVLRDELTDDKAPEITGVRVMMAVRAKGELTTWAVYVPLYQLLRNQGAPASQWTIDLGARVPCDRLTLEIMDASFSRPFYIESVDDPENVRLIASGELTRHVGEARPLVITFDEEVYARKLRLLITDYSNQTLSITSIQASAPARQLVFELKEPSAQPLRLFFGNPKVTAPHYDFEKELPLRLLTKPGQPALSGGQGSQSGQPDRGGEPIHSTVGSVVTNPEFIPEPLPLTERVPWLIYLVLAASSVALAFILLSLARAALQTEPQSTESQPTEEPSQP
jgi:hypothetical protein